MTLANAMILVDQTAVPLALPDIMKSFRVGSQDVQWVLTGSLLPLAGLLVFGGRLGDLVGLRRVFLVGAATFAGASAVGAAAPDLPLLLAARVLQGTAGALMLPTSVAIVSAAFPPAARGRALGTMGGAAAVAAALGPTIGGTLTSALSWRAVLLINVPLAIVTVVLVATRVPADAARDKDTRAGVDIQGATWLSIALVGLVFGLSESQQSTWGSTDVLLPLGIALVAAAGFVLRERRARQPLVDFALLRHRNYLGASLSQLLSGMAEIGLGVIFPLLLILNLTMDPALAGLALIPTTLPMIAVAPLAGRWYDRVGGKAPLVTGFALLALSGVLLAITADDNSYAALLPGLLVYGVGLALVLTVNDPVTLDTIPEKEHGQASGVSATAEQFGGALGIAVLYSIFHANYLDQLHERVARSPLPELSSTTGAALRHSIEAAQATGMRIDHLDPAVRGYIFIARDASNYAYSVVFVAVAAIALVAACLVGWLVSKPQASSEPSSASTAGSGDVPSRT